MRNMSFSLTTPQILAGTKTVTRRLGWKHVKVGELIQAIEKGQGLKKGQKVRKLRVIRVVAVRREPFWHIHSGEVLLEGFTDGNLFAFVRMFCKANRCSPRTVITRIEFEYAT